MEEIKIEEKNNVVINDSKGYGYNYASLSDIAKQGYTIPKMTTKTDELTLKEYVYYYDEELKEWLRGAEVVIPENVINKDGKAKMNSAQLYGSALTYARRYTTLMALQLACDDDKNIENSEEIKTTKEDKKATEKQIELIKKLYEQHDELLAYCKVDKFEDLTIEQASELIKRKKNNNE